MHFFASSGLRNMHVLQVHPGVVSGLFIPAAAQSKPPAGGTGADAAAAGGDTAAGFAPGRGASQIVHFSFALSGFLSEHIPHVHSADDDAVGAFMPAAAQSKALGADLGAAPGRGASQTVHFSFALSGFLSAHVSHVHSVVVCVDGAFIPAAAQSNAFGAGAGAAPGRGASHTVHFSLALSGFFSAHVSHIHSALDAAAGCFIPAAAQLNAFGAAFGAAPGRGASQTVHFSFALSGFFSEHVPHVHSADDDGVGAFMPAAAQSKALGADLGAASGRGASQTVHFSFALSGFLSEHVPHVHSALDDAGCFMPAAVQSNVFGADAAIVDVVAKSKV